MLPRILSLAVGGLGGALFSLFDLPLAWMLGAMTVSMVLAIRGVKLTIDLGLRQIMIAVLGVMLGSSFSPNVIAMLAQWSWGIALLLAAILLSTLVVYFFYRKVAKLDHITAYFSAVPGGFNLMYEIGSQKGGNGAVIALIHASRIALLVMVLPLFFRYGIDIQPSASPLLPHVGFADIQDLLLLLGCGLIGYFLGKLLRLPAPHLMGPLLISAAAHMTSIVTTPPPDLLINIAQVVIGTAIGLRFHGTTLRDIRRVVSLSIASTTILVAIAALLALLSADFIGVTSEGLTLALAPGGLAEMSLVALSLNLDVAFVSLMHVLRIGIVILIVPPCFEIIEKIRK